MATTNLAIDATHDAVLHSWVDSANNPDTDFPIQNLPYCAFEEAGVRRLATRIGDTIVDLGLLARTHAFSARFPGEKSSLQGVGDALASGDLSRVAALGAQAGRAIRHAISHLLRADVPDLRDDTVLRAKACRNVQGCSLVLTHRIGDYTDFYASIDHASTVGAMFRPDNPLLPNYTWVPIGYHGRASSIVISGTPIRRPRGQTKADDAQAPVFGPCKLLDYELEVGAFIGQGNARGSSIPIAQASEHILGLCLVNDWSARDVQKWEYQPLGPFLAKNFATSVSPYIVTLDALAPFRVPARPRTGEQPASLPYLADPADQASGGFDISVEAWLETPAMRAAGHAPVRLSRGSMKHMYWTLAQMVTHHASNGCNLEPGDLIASGTVSGPEPEARGCLLELTWDAPGKPRKPISLPGGETRTFLQDGDRVILRGSCGREGFRRVGFGACEGTITPVEAG